jgi:hypothetical protein
MVAMSKMHRKKLTEESKSRGISIRETIEMILDDFFAKPAETAAPKTDFDFHAEEFYCVDFSSMMEMKILGTESGGPLIFDSRKAAIKCAQEHEANVLCIENSEYGVDGLASYNLAPMAIPVPDNAILLKDYRDIRPISVRLPDPVIRVGEPRVAGIVPVSRISQP